MKELSEPTPDSFYINGKKLYTVEYVKELEAKLVEAETKFNHVDKMLQQRTRDYEWKDDQLVIAIEALELISNHYGRPTEMMAEARQALRKIKIPDGISKEAQ